MNDERLRLPEFVTAAGIEERLAWPPSLRRTLGDALSRSSEGRSSSRTQSEDVYAAVLELAALPGGMRRFEAIVKSVDRSKRRGLLTALQRTLPMGSKRLSRAQDLVETLEGMLDGGAAEEAAWIVFHRLSFAEPGAAAVDEPGLDEVTGLVGRSTILRRLLGGYWTDWLAVGAPRASDPSPIAKEIGPSPRSHGRAGEAQSPIVVPIADAEARRIRDGTDARHEWSAAVKATIAMLNAVEPFDPDMPLRLEALVATTRRLIADEARRSEEISRRLLDEARASLDEALDRLRASATPPIVVPDEIAEADDPGVIESATRWANDAEAALGRSADRCAAATLRRDVEDSDEADDDHAAANKERRSLRLRIEAEARDMAKPSRTRVSKETFPEPSTSDVALNDADGLSIPGSDSTADQAEPAALAPERHSSEAHETGAAHDRADATSTIRKEDVTAEITPDGQAWEEPAFESLQTFLPQSAPPIMDEARALSRLAERALREGRYGFAAHLARASGVLGAPAQVGKALMIEALAVGTAVSERRASQAASSYARLEGRLYEVAESGLDLASRLLVMAGALRPAIFSSQTSAAETFRLAEPGTLGTSLHQLSDFLAELPRRGGHLEFGDLKPAADEQQRLRAAAEARDALLRAVDEAGDRRAVYQRATTIMVGLLETDPVGEAIAAIRRSASNAVERAEAAAGWIDEDVDRRIEQLDDEARRPRRGAPLEGMARRWLVQRLNEAAALLRRWATAEKAARGVQSGHAGEVRLELRQLLSGAAETIRGLSVDEDAIVAREVLVRSIADTMATLDGFAGEDPELDVEMLLHDDLLLLDPFPGIGPDRHWTDDEALMLVEVAQEVLDRPADFGAAFERLVHRGSFFEAEAAIARMEAQGDDVAGMLDRMQEERRRFRETLLQEAQLLRRRLDDVLGADTAGRVDLSLQVRVDALIQGLGDEPAMIDYPTAERRLRTFQQEVGDLAELLLAPLRTEIEDLGLPPATAETLRRMADKGDLTTLREHVDAAREGADLGTSAGERLKAFARDFLGPAYEKLGAAARNTSALIDAAASRRKVEAADFSLLKDEDVAGSTELLRTWRALRGAKIDTPAGPAALRDLMTALRFTSVRISGSQALPPARRFGLACDPVADRRDCPVPSFGSAANGAYAVIAIDTVAVKNGADLFNLVRRLEAPTTRPTFIVVVGTPLPSSRRREYMVEARRRGALEPCALIDEAVILQLASRPGRGLSDLFAVALPMGAIQPYSDANGQTSPEMFFGRDAELTQLWDRFGSCLVYGGRQLGKTALLEQLRLRHHRPPAQVVVGGSIQGVTDIWPWLQRSLKGAEVPVRGTHAKAVCDSVRDWLARDEARRIVVLVDEADIFLQAEMSGDYSSLIRVRELMQDTGRRCKFVFAGLHNVQRLARQPNSPLLHFGTPLRVGPLYGAELGEARAMIERPMAAAGLTYSADTLPGRVLSELGYYPSLMQTFGKTMIERVNRSAATRMPTNVPLPIVIAERDIDDVLTDPHFRNDLSDKFEATLSLDERYRLITYAMLVHSMDRRGSGPALQDVEVQERALRWWPQGFAEDSTLDAFQGLLQEMVGLGVLIEAEGRYAIRSSRIATMLGGREEIERKLLEMSELPGYQKLDTGSFRRLDGGDAAPSPLTARQESVTLAQRDAPPVQLVLGSKALGLDALAGSLESLADEELGVERASYTSLPQMLARVEVPRERRTLLVLTGPWPGADGVAALLRSEAVRRSRRGGRRTLQVLLAPVTTEWRDLAEVDATGRLWGIDLLALAPLGETGLRQWLRAVAGADTADTVGRLKELTGGFPLFLRGLAGKNATEILEAAETAAGGLSADPETLVALGLDDPRLLRTARLVAELGGHAGKATEDLLADDGVEAPAAALAHLERLGLLELGARPLEERSLNPFVASLLTSSTE